MDAMDGPFSSPGMITASAFVFVVQALSVGLLLLNVHLFRVQSGKYRAFLRSLGNEEAWGNPGRFVLPAYIAGTVAATAAITLIFLFQPHIL